MRIAIGLGENENVLKAIEQFPFEIDVARTNKELLEYYHDPDVDGIIRGSLESDIIMEIRKEHPHIFRATILEKDDHIFLLAPVGIDECDTINAKKKIIKECSKILKEIGNEARIALISSGRKQDKGRSHKIDRSIEECEQVVEDLKDEYDIKHYYILLEEAIKDKADVIIAPDGIIGNIIFRSLVLVAGIKSYGAITLKQPKLFIDTSILRMRIENMFLLQPLYSVYEWYISRNLDPESMPKHVAIIMDGNRRYSKLQGNKSAIEGHKRGVDTLENVLEWCIDLGIDIVTVYAFSTENFNRSKEEVNDLMKLFVDSFLSISTNKKIHKNHVRLKAVGKLELFPQEVRDAILDAEKSTEQYDERLINIAMGYDGRIEIVDAFKKLAQDVKDGKLEPEDIDEKLINENLYTKGLEDPNLVIRTSGEERLSGFLLWQSSYSELYFTDSLWPELRKVDFLRAIRSYTKRQRRFGR